MNEKSPIVNFTNVTALMVTFGLGYALIRGNLESPRPFPLEASHVSDTADAHKVESRLWQDPFEPFESATNQAASAKGEVGGALRLFESARPSATPDPQPWIGINRRAMKPNNIVNIIGVMLEGSSYAEDKEVRLRTRYAVEMAFSTSEVGPEDRIHIFTNSVPLACPEETRDSKFAYEWFVDDFAKTNTEYCVLWLNEYDFSANPMLQLGSLLTNIPALTNKDPNVHASFYLIGPRASDTLRSLARFDANSTNANFLNIKTAASLNNFHILSPEATAAVYGPKKEDLFGERLSADFESIFCADVFANWITTDQMLANLIAKELTNRVESGNATDNIVVLLSEQDTYYGRELADEWIHALTNSDSRVCAQESDVWQFAYLRGLDGSKPAKDKSSDNGSQEKSSAAASSPEAALQPLLQQQHQGLKADGNAQLDYIVRLGEFLRTQDKRLRARNKSRILAVGLTGSDSYDKLTILRELSRDLPQAVFFTTDLDAPLWTSSELPYTRNLLVGSAYPLEANPESNSYPFMQQFPPFRDVYQTAVFQACNTLVQSNPPCLTNAYANMRGGLYRIGRRGPVRLAAEGDSCPAGRTPADPGVFNFPWTTFLFLLCISVLAMTLKVASSAGFRQLKALPIPNGPIHPVEAARFKERDSQMPFWALLIAVAVAAAVGLLCWCFASKARAIASHPGEEPWNFLGGVSIWPSEWIRFLDVLAGVVFFWIALWSRQLHRRRLWEKYFREEDPAPGDWRSFWKKCLARWRPKLGSFDRAEIRLADSRDLWEKSGRARNKPEDYRVQADSELDQERKIWFGLPWMPPFLENPEGANAEACVNAFALFRSYLCAGRFRIRLRRIFAGMAVYFAMLVSMIYCLDSVPSRFFIRGAASRQFDTVLILVVLFTFLFSLFYVLDGALLTGRFLNCISRFPTRWPDRLLRENAARFGVDTRFLDGFLDVDFAAFQTKEVGTLMFGPVIILLILALSRSRYFDNWAWPPGLIVTYAINFLVAAICWWIVRRAADKVRRLALERMADSIASVENSKENSFDALTPEGLRDFKKAAPGTDIKDYYSKAPKADYLKRLKSIQEAMQTEHRGAYARAFQDPTYLAVFLPSGATGIVSLIGSLWMNR